MTRSQIIKKIHNAAVQYKQHFIGKTYMFVFKSENDKESKDTVNTGTDREDVSIDNCIEVMFKKSSFKHLTGVDSRLRAEDFYSHALKKGGLKPSEISFSATHPFDLARKKAEHLSNLHNLTTQEVKIVTDFTTATFTYSIGITNMELVLCLGPDYDKNGNTKSGYLVPYSFRVEEITDNRYSNLCPVTHILSKSTSERKYATLTFGDEAAIPMLKEDIKKKIEL